MTQTKRIILIRETTWIAAPPERVFALSTSVPLVQRTLGFKPIEGVTDGHVVMGSRVVWKGWLFGLLQRHHTLITGYRPPQHVLQGVEQAWFQDTQEAGRFQFFQHDHLITAEQDGTRLRDEIRFSLPFGAAGFLVGRFLLEPFIRRTLRSRFGLLTKVAESEQWHDYV